MFRSDRTGENWAEHKFRQILRDHGLNDQRGFYVGVKGTFVAPVADLPDDFELPSAGPLYADYGVEIEVTDKLDDYLERTKPREDRLFGARHNELCSCGRILKYQRGGWCGDPYYYRPS